MERVVDRDLALAIRRAGATGRKDGSSAFLPLAGLYGEGHTRLRDQVMGALAGVGADAVPALVQALGTNLPGAGPGGAGAGPSGAGGQGRVPALRAALADGNRDVRVEAAWALALVSGDADLAVRCW